MVYCINTQAIILLSHLKHIHNIENIEVKFNMHM